MNSLYLWINLVTITFPLLLSFDKKVAFYKNFKYLFPSIFLTAIFFLCWDEWFTQMQIWGFNSKYILGYYVSNMPIEEVLFFFTVPYACIFIYECLKAYFNQNEVFEKLHRWFTLLLFGIACTFLYWFNDKLYTGVTSIMLFFMLGTHLIVIKRRYMSWFYFAFLISLIPMMIVNGLLTAKPVVFYNPNEIIGLRIGTIPIEDFLYNLTMLIMCVGLYEWFKRIGNRQKLKTIKQPLEK
ncbi:MAG: lycopene cyclase domain-containing protein [Bacteroidetes bacterium]|nr:lycopene cyclase domain-containing protein [Bacteroidota bacterium]